MSRLLLHKPRQLGFKHFIEKDLSKWYAKYNNNLPPIDILVKYAAVEILEFYAMIDNSPGIFGMLAAQGRLYDINIYISNISNIPHISNIQQVMLEYALHYGAKQIDVIFRFKHLLANIFISSYYTDYQLKIITNIYYKSDKFTKQKIRKTVNDIMQVYLSKK